ncbi:MAG: 2-C-methyl-D-erythritol 4-phosphate cytidylyltransferase [Selenomonadaceae bacterium]|nr:2-C-methyl-D-erythritol 4-phosphate cytidylyltransferase [Selenomonadaceae bacterium]
MVSVIFPAAGQGKRMGAGFNKVFLKLAGKEIIRHTLRRFSDVPAVGELIVVTGKEDLSHMQTILREEPGLKPWRVVAGGSERQYSVKNGLAAISREADIVLVHDAARPLVSRETIEAVIRAARLSGAAIAAVPEKNTVKIVSGDGVVVRTPDRRTLWAVQTPQGFRRGILLRANERAEEEHFLGTDDASLVERIGTPVHVVRDRYENIKITTPGDLAVAEAFLKEGAK